MLAPRGEVSASSKTSTVDSGRELAADPEEVFPPSGRPAWGSLDGRGSVSVQIRLFAASAFADNDLWCFFTGLQIFLEVCSRFDANEDSLGEVLPGDSVPVPAPFGGDSFWDFWDFLLLKLLKLELLSAWSATVNTPRGKAMLS